VTLGSHSGAYLLLRLEADRRLKLLLCAVSAFSASRRLKNGAPDVYRRDAENAEIAQRVSSEECEVYRADVMNVNL